MQPPLLFWFEKPGVEDEDRVEVVGTRGGVQQGGVVVQAQALGRS
jgi:hypothetical protein